MAKKKAQNPTSSSSAESSDAESIEDAMTELAEIVVRLETGQESLDDSLQQFERGMALLRLCHQKLDFAAQRIEIVTRLAEGEPVEVEEFDSTSSLQKKSRGTTLNDTEQLEESGDEESSGKRRLF